MRWILPLVVCLSFAATAGSAASTMAVEFSPPVRLEADKKIIRVEDPGYAAPTWADADGDGKMDLVVGQFSGGKILIFKNAGNNVLQAGQFLKVDGKVAQVPGVW